MTEEEFGVKWRKAAYEEGHRARLPQRPALPEQYATRAQKRARTASTIVAEAKKGGTYTEIAQRAGVTRPRVTQVLKEAGLYPLSGST